MKTATKSIIAGVLFFLMGAAPVMAADQELNDSATLLRTQDKLQDRTDQVDDAADQEKLQLQEKVQQREQTRDRISRPDVSSSRPDSSSRPTMGSRPSAR